VVINMGDIPEININIMGKKKGLGDDDGAR
jgi:hypothetical protein